MSAVVFISGKAALANFIGEVQGDSVDRLAASDYNATRFLTNSLRNSVTDQPGATRAELFGAGYWKFVGNGRGPGKPPPLAPILKWVQAKGLASGSQGLSAPTSALTTNNVNVIQGEINVTATGTMLLRFASSSAVNVAVTGVTGYLRRKA